MCARGFSFLSSLCWRWRTVSVENMWKLIEFSVCVLLLLVMFSGDRRMLTSSATMPHEKACNKKRCYRICHENSTLLSNGIVIIAGMRWWTLNPSVKLTKAPGDIMHTTKARLTVLIHSSLIPRSSWSSSRLVSFAAIQPRRTFSNFLSRWHCKMRKFFATRESRQQQQQQKDSTMTLEFVVVGRMRSKRESELWIVLKERKSSSSKKVHFHFIIRGLSTKQKWTQLAKKLFIHSICCLMLFAMKTTTNRFWALERRQHEMKHIHTRSSQRAGENNR